MDTFDRTGTSRIEVVREWPTDLPVRGGKVWKGERPWGPELEPEGTGIHAIAVMDERHGRPVTRVYFEEAVAAVVDAVIEETSYGRFRGSPDRYAEEHRGRTLHVVLTEEGRKRFFDPDHLELLRDMLDPAGYSRGRLGGGSEGEVHLRLIDGREYAVKVFSAEMQERINEFTRRIGLFFPAPDFTERVGFTDSVLDAVRGFPLTRCSLTTLTEYAAGPSFVLMDPGPGLDLEDLFAFMGITETRQETDTEAAKAFLDTHAVTKDDLSVLHEELKALDDYCDLIRHFGYARFGSSRLKHDFTGKNLLVEGFDPTDRRLRLVLIDQGQVPPLSDRNPINPEAERRWVAQREFDRLQASPLYRAFLERQGMSRP